MNPAPTCAPHALAPASRAWLVVLMVVLSALLASCAGERAYQQSQQELMTGNSEESLLKLQDALKANPDNKQYRETFEQHRAALVSRYIAEADVLRASLAFDAAAARYEKALKWDPENKRAKAALAAIEAAKGDAKLLANAREDVKAGRLEEASQLLRKVLAQTPSNREARDLLQRIEDVRSEQQPAPGPTLKGQFSQPITLEFRDAALKSVFEVISRSSGINFVFDRDVRSDTKVNIFVRNTSLDDVVRLILLTNQLERKMLNDNTVLIYPNTPAKQKEYKELVVRSFYLANADVKQALNLVKGMVKTPDVFIDEKLNLMVVKDTPDAVRLIGNLVRSMDLAEPEVMLEVEVLELASSKIDTLGVRYPDSIRLGTPGTGAAGALTDTFVIGDSTMKAFVANPAIVIDLLSQDSVVRVLANPRIRVKNREKAKVHIGDKVPVITTTSTANVGVSSSVSYLDVGLKLDVEPNVYLRDDVAMKVSLEVSNIRRTVDIQGTRAYELGTRNTATLLQVHDGETQILAGLISDEDRRNAQKVPGLGDFPILGQLFRSSTEDRRKTEIVLLITPRIVRPVIYPQSAVMDLPVGTDAAIGSPPVRISATTPGQLSIAPSGAGGGAGARGVPGVPGAGGPNAGVPPGVPGVPGVPGQNNQPQREVPAPGEVAESEAGPGQEPAAAGPSNLLMAAPLSARAGSDIVVSLSLAPGGGAAKATAELAYDPLQLEAVGSPVSTPGRVPIRIDGSAAVRFRVLLAGGRAQVRVENVAGQDRSGATVPVSEPGPVEMSVQ